MIKKEDIIQAMSDIQKRYKKIDMEIIRQQCNQQIEHANQKDRERKIRQLSIESIE
jgi:hypothetical protein